MRTRIFIAVFLLIAVCGFTSESFAEKPGTTPPMGVGVVQAGSTVTIYKNYGARSWDVTVTVSDYSTGTDSILTGTSTGSSTPNVVTVPDNNTVTATFWVGPVGATIGGGNIVLKCLGTDGYCLYKIDDIGR